VADSQPSDDDVLERDLNRTRISSHDFQQAGKYLAALGRHATSSVEYSALLSSAVISYARPFGPNEKEESALALARLAIAPDDVLSLEEKALHDDMLLLRNKAIAHAEYTNNPVRRVESGPTGVTMAGHLMSRA
jgi:hypothetical protein